MKKKESKMKKEEEKTNVMRVLDSKKIKYKSHNYVATEAIAGDEVAKTLGQDPNAVFKTLVTVSKSKSYYVFLVPVSKELDLKKAAKAVGEKKIEMLKSKDAGGRKCIVSEKTCRRVPHRSGENRCARMFCRWSSGGRLRCFLASEMACRRNGNDIRTA